jgi:hypothetical protein
MVPLFRFLETRLRGLLGDGFPGLVLCRSLSSRLTCPPQES